MSINFKFSQTFIKDISDDYLNKEITVSGWIQIIRKQNPLIFINLNDGSTVNNLQVVLTEKTEEFDRTKLSRGCSIQVTGLLIDSPKDGQKYELQGLHVKIYGLSPPSYPINKQAKNLEYLRTIPHMRIRTLLMKSVHKIRNTLSIAIHNYFQGIGCHYVHTPLITGNDCEGAGETFTITTQYPKDKSPVKIDSKKELFKKPAYLTVSGQLHGESYAMGLGNIYTFGPTFRAENSHTNRHLNEFWMIEPELSFINQKELHMLTEDFLKYCVQSVLDKNGDELDFLEQYDKELKSKLENVVKNDFPRVSYEEAIDILKEKYEKTEDEEEIEFGIDMSSNQEKFLTDVIFKSPIIVYNYPKVIKSFYMKANTDNKTVQAMDLLVPTIGELIGGSIREDDFEKLDKIVKEKKIKDLDWYMDLRKYGSVPHGGFGLGFERLVQMCSGMKNIRDVIPYPRYPKTIMC